MEMDLPRYAAKRDQPFLRTVPEVIALFWVTKVLTTGLGEATSDFLVHAIVPIVAVAIGAAGLAVAMSLQFASRRYNPWVYWLAVAMVAIFGTMAAGFLHVEVHIPYAISSVFFSIALALVFSVWYATERTLSIHTINTPRREAFYWLTVMTTFALGTAAGDMTATTLRLGFLLSGVVFAVLIAIPAVAHRWLAMNAIFAFWFAYIITGRSARRSPTGWVCRTLVPGSDGEAGQSASVPPPCSSGSSAISPSAIGTSRTRLRMRAEECDRADRRLVDPYRRHRGPTECQRVGTRDHHRQRCSLVGRRDQQCREGWTRCRCALHVGVRNRNVGILPRLEHDEPRFRRNAVVAEDPREVVGHSELGHPPVGDALEIRVSLHRARGVADVLEHDVTAQRAGCAEAVGKTRGEIGAPAPRQFCRCRR
jgi:uncharacterized membrane-anchored protein